MCMRGMATMLLPTAPVAANVRVSTTLNVTTQVLPGGRRRR